MCSICRDIDYPGLFGRGRRKYALGYLDQIKGKPWCPSCRLVQDAVDNASWYHDEPSTDAKSRLYGVLTSSNSTRPLGSGRHRALELVLYISIDNEKSRQILATSYIRLHKDDAHKVHKAKYFNGRGVNQYTADTELIEWWLRDCDQKHQCTKVAPTVELTPRFYLIDTLKKCIVLEPQGVPYAALSYTWPRRKALMLQTTNLADLRKEGSLSTMNGDEYISPVIMDAMELCLRLDCKHLWVDALCIIQDDKGHLRQMIKIMDRVYNKSYLTIVAANTGNDVEGLPGFRPGTRRTPPDGVQIDNLRLLPALPPLNEAIRVTPWATRAWTYQEATLAPRCLFFTPYQAYFRCVENSRCEDVLTEGADPFVTVHPARSKTVTRNTEFIGSFLKVTSGDYMDNFLHYATSVQQYSRRVLSYQEDGLTAFSGLTNYLRAVLPDGFTSGLPVRYLDMALLWVHTGHACRRQGKGFPSWSWVGWVGQADFELELRFRTEDCQVRSEIVWYERDDESVKRLRSNEDRNGPLEPRFSQGMLTQKAFQHEQDAAHLVFWANTARMSVSIREKRMRCWVMDFHQHVPASNIYGSDGRSCGYAISIDRDWLEQRDKDKVVEDVDVVMLSHRWRTEFDLTHERLRFFDKSRYLVDGHPDPWCLVNVMLVRYREDGCAVRLAVGRMHVDAWENSERKLVTLA